MSDLGDITGHDMETGANEGEPTAQQLADDQAAAIRQFRNWASDPKTLLIDTETTGLEGRIWEFAAVSDAAVTLAYQANAQGAAWSAEAAAMHAQRRDGIRHAPSHTIFEAATVGLLRSTRPVAYNAEFEAGALRRTYPSANIPPIECAMLAYAPLAGEWSTSRQCWKVVSLEKALELEGVNPLGLPPAHQAIGDALRLTVLVHTVAAEGRAAYLAVYRELLAAWLEFDQAMGREGHNSVARAREWMHRLRSSLAAPEAPHQPRSPLDVARSGPDGLARMVNYLGQLRYGISP